MSDILSPLYCPACKGISRYLTHWQYSGLNDSIFNYVALFYECTHCGLVYIENITDEKLTLFYKQECSYFEKPHFDITSPGNIEKYKIYKNFFVEAGLIDQSLTDVGCGRGGFLFWLKSNIWNASCIGVDIDLKSIPALDNKNYKTKGLSFMEGTAFSLPFSDDSQSLLTYFHVLEHIRNIDFVLREAFRVLNVDGYVLIEVPDAEKYMDYPVGSAFWFSIREHIYHFSACSLSNVLIRNGFEVVKVCRQTVPTPEFNYPSLMVLAKKRYGTPLHSQCMERSNLIATYAIQSLNDLKYQAEKVLSFSSNYETLTIWGCSSELFSLLPLFDFKYFTLCDSSKAKQQCFYNDIAISNPRLIDKTGALVVAPYLHGNSIVENAIELGWAKEDIFMLK